MTQRECQRHHVQPRGAPQCPSEQRGPEGGGPAAAPAGAQLHQGGLRLQDGQRLLESRDLCLEGFFVVDDGDRLLDAWTPSAEGREK